MRRSKLASLARVAAFAALAGATACSGGGGGGPGGGGSNPGFTLSPSAVTFSARQNDPVPAPANVSATITATDAAYIVAGFPPGTTPPGWLNLSLYGSGTHWTLSLSILSTTLAPSPYTTTVRVVLARADQSIIGTRDLAVTYTVSPNISVSPASLAFAHIQGGPTETKQLAVAGSAGVAFSAAATQPWVTFDATSGTTPASVTVGFDPTGLAPGPYQANVTISGAGRTLTVPVSLQIAAPELRASTASLSYSGVNGAPIATKDVQVSMNNGTATTFTATPSAGWIVVGASTGTTPATVTVGIDPSVGPLAAGPHDGTVTFSTSGGAPLTATVDVHAALTRATLTVPSSLLLGGADGRSSAAVPLAISLDTGPNAHGWSAVPSAAWMSLSAASGNASATSGSIDVSPIPTGLTGGTRTASIAFTATVNGDTVTASVPVTFNLEAHKVLASAQGVAFTKTPGPTRLTRTLRVNDNLGRSAPWTATSDQAWLSVTPSGTAPSDLVLTADPAGLAADELYLATVTLSSPDASVENAETIRVGLWIGSTAPTSPAAISGTYAEVVTDPIRPYLYAHNKGSSVAVFNVHDLALVGTIPSVAGSLAGMAISGDGSKLFAVDKATWKLVGVDLDTWEVGAPVNLANTTNAYPRVAWTRTNGRPVLVVADGTARDPADGNVLWSRGYGYSFAARVEASLDGSVFCDPLCHSLGWTSVGGGALQIVRLTGSLGDTDGALSPDGTVVYVPNMSQYNWIGSSTETGALVIQLEWGQAYPDNVEVGWDGRIYCGRSHGISYEPDVFVFTPAGAEIATMQLSSEMISGQMRLSGDGLRLVAPISDYYPTSNAIRLANTP